MNDGLESWELAMSDLNQIVALSLAYPSVCTIDVADITAVGVGQSMNSMCSMRAGAKRKQGSDPVQAPEEMKRGRGSDPVQAPEALIALLREELDAYNTSL